MKRRDEVLVGILLTVAVSIAIVGTLWLARGGLSPGYPLHARFPWGAGLRQGQPVLLAGVNVGYVDRVELQRDGWLFVTIRINNDYEVPEGSTATVVPVGIFGDAAVALTPAAPSLTSYAAGDTVPLGQPRPTLDDLIARLDTVGRTISDVTGAIELQLVDEGGLAELRQTIRATNRLIVQLNDIATQQSRELSATTASLRSAAGAVDSVAVANTVQGLQQSSQNLASLTAELNQASSRLTSTLAKVDTGMGTAGRLVNDTSLYRDMRSLLTRIDSLAADFQRNPRRYINLTIF